MILGSFQGGEVAMLVTIFLLLFVLIFLSVAEMGLSRMTKPKAAAILDQGHRSGPALLKLVADPERWVNPVLLTVNICQTVQATLTGLVAGNLFGPIGVVIGVVLNVLVFFVLAEAVPKTYAVLHPERAALIAARPTLALARFPVLSLISKGLIGLTNVIMPGKGLEKGPFVSEQEFLGIVEAAAEDDVIEQRERQLIESIIEFGDTVASEIMVPRPDMVVVASSQPIGDALDTALAHGYSRMPVVTDRDGEDAIGLAYLKDLVKADRAGDGDALVESVVRPVVYIPENKPVASLMREMQERKFHLAVVVDEYGAIAGLVTLEDCLEELVGDIVDEYDNETDDVTRLTNGEYLVNGTMPIGDLADLLDVQLPDEDWHTVGGFVFGTLGHVPKAGESVTLGGWCFAAETVVGRRIRQVRVFLDPAITADPGADDRSVDA